MRLRNILCAFIGIAAMAWAGRADATFHLWRIEQVYSNKTGSIQYVDLVLPFTFDDESHLTGHQLIAGLNSNTLTFGSDLPQVPVAGQHFLVATAGFSTVAGVMPDYTFPSSFVPFFNRAGDSLNFAFVDSFTFPALPSDGVHALNRDNSIVVNEPVNFAGKIGFITDNPDTNNSGFVDISDIQVVAANYLMTGLTGDANHDGLVDISDIQVIAAHWLQTWPPAGNGAGAGVPEPATFTLLIMGVALALSLGCRRLR
ncbi:MAG: hypothetical protein HYX69_07915 [Planctomycetia bacterium]|nr:hypothetical protein [Planctomycetia bacterium]